MTGQHIRPWWMFSPRKLWQPFSSAKLDYCGQCHDEFAAIVEQATGLGVTVYRKTCPRCGTVLQFGIDRSKLASNRPLPAAAIRFIRQAGRDRR